MRVNGKILKCEMSGKRMAVTRGVLKLHIYVFMSDYLSSVWSYAVYFSKFQMLTFRSSTHLTVFVRFQPSFMERIVSRGTYSLWLFWQSVVLIQFRVIGYTLKIFGDNIFKALLLTDYIHSISAKFYGKYGDQGIIQTYYWQFAQ